MKKEQWILQGKKADFNQIAKDYNISPMLARIIRNRDVIGNENIDKYLYGTVNNCYNPRLLKGMKEAETMIVSCIENNEIIGISSDFDNDGIFASMILLTGLRRVGAKVKTYTPDRVKEGYGINHRIVDEALEQGVSLILTCDNGIAAIEPIAYAKSKGLKVIVTDHHEIPFVETEQGRQFVYPEADVIINPKMEDCPYPFKKLCGAAVTYKLIEVLYERYHIKKEELYDLLEYTAIATVADVMDLVDENRILVKEGLARLRKTKNLGLKALMEVNQLNMELINSYHIGFVIGPCFNAAGRLDTVKIALDLLQATTYEEAMVLATQLKQLNTDRKEMTVKGVEQAIDLIEHSQLKNDSVLCVRLHQCHESLVGIIAGRIREKYHKPALVFTDGGEGIKGSGRSIEEYDMFEGLIRCKSLLGKFGGHPMAAGLSLEEANLEQLRTQLNEQCGLTKEDLTPKVYIDVPMPIQYVTDSFIESLEQLEPFGKGNAKPLFAEQHFKILKATILGKNKNVLKMKVMNQEGYMIEAMYFGDIDTWNDHILHYYGKEELEAMYLGNQNNIDMGFTYYPTKNEFRGQITLQIVIQNYCVIQGK